MSNINIKLHEFQKVILKKLTKQTNAHFNDLLIPGLESEHMNYHLKKLLDIGLVQKDDGIYSLTFEGKDYVNLMDDNIEVIEKQPKTSVLLRVVRKRKDGEVEHLLCRRLRHPYYGKVGYLTGKVRFGETLKEAALRELLEETGLSAETCELEHIFHKVRFAKDGACVQDVIFYKFLMTETNGTFIEKTDWQENFWVTEAEANDSSKYDRYDTLKLSTRLTPHELTFAESVGTEVGF